jgi:aspartyl protease family protein
VNNKIYIKFIILLAISTTITFCIYKIIPKYSFNFIWAESDIISVFITVLIMVSIIFNTISKGNIKGFSAQLFTWLSIFLVIIVGYAFRFELNYASQRVASVLLPSHNWINTQGEMVINRNSDGHFYINAVIKGISIKFMIDTGASDVALTSADAKKLNYDLSKLNYNKTYSTANGFSKAAPVELDNVIIGPWTFNNIKGHVSSGESDISLLGMSLLERFKGFKIDRDMLILSY